MLDQSFKSFLETKTRPLVIQLARHGVHPDLLTWLGFFISSTSFFWTIADRPVLALSFWWGGRLFDGLDGQLARATGRQSLRGGFLDINLDMAAYSLIALGFMLHTQQYVLWAVVIIGYVLCITSALSLGEMQEAKDNRTLKIASGLAEAGETGIFYSLCWIFPQQTKFWCVSWLAVMGLTVISRYVRAYKKD
jgi:phosphatidylglycerophosphate synthase